MKLSYVTDSLGDLSYEKMLDTCAELGFEQIEFACGNWSQAPHINLDQLLASNTERDSFLLELNKRNLEISAFNCSGNQLAPNDSGKEHDLVVKKTFKLAELLGVNTIVMMSGLPGGGPNDEFPNWITTSWPPVTQEILEWQWNEVAIPYWENTVELAKNHGIEKIALENHGYQLVYNVETLFKLRNNVDEMIGMNLDPSHLFWMGGDPIAAARKLGEANAIHYVHAKDVRLEKGLVNINGLLDTKTIDEFSIRTWNYVALGHGHGLKWWKEFFTVLSMTGYDGTVSLEMEDLTMDALTGVKKSVNVVKEALPKIYE